MTSNWPSPQEFNSDRILLMTAGAQLYLQWLEEITFHGVLSLLDHTDNLNSLAARMTDHQLPTFSKQLSEIKSSLDENQYEFAYISDQLTYLALLAHGIIRLDKLPLNIQWHAITAGGMNLTKTHLERHETKHNQHLYVMSVEKTMNVDVPYQKVWFSNGKEFFMFLEYSFQGDFKKTFYPQKSYDISFFRYPDYNINRIYILENKSVEAPNPFSSISSMSEAIKDLQQKLKTLPFTPTFPMIFTYSHADNTQIYGTDKRHALPFRANEIMEEILRLSTLGIAFGEFRNGIFHLLAVVVDGELISSE